MKCPRCGSQAIRRSMPRTRFERLVRAWTPYHYFLCRECEYRGSHLGAIPLAAGGDARQVPSRPLEVRDHEAHRRRRKQLVLSFVVASVLGIASGVYLQSCRHSSELEQMQASEVEQHRIE